MNEYKRKANQHEDNANLYSKYSSRCYDAGDFGQCVKWDKACDAEWVNYNYFWGLYLESNGATT